MSAVTPCRALVSERFPVASFVVEVPPERCFELACATDPALFHPTNQPQRTAKNFWTSRFGGLMRAPAGRATYLLPPEQLRHFAGAPRLYYALGTYGGVNGERPQFSIQASQPERIPYIRIAPDFTGRSLDRRRLEGVAVGDNRYGRKAHDLVWGGDLLERAAPAHSWRGAPGDGAADGATADGATADGATAVLLAPAPSVRSPVASPDLLLADEPSGCEHPDELATSAHSPVALDVDDGQEPYGRQRSPRRTSSAPQFSAPQATPRAARPAARAPAAYGRRGTRYGSADEETSESVTAWAEHDPDFSDDDDGHATHDDDAQPVLGSAGRKVARQLAASELDLAEKFRIVQLVAEFESGLQTGDLDQPQRRARAYGAINANTDGAGLSWGLIQFTQSGGALGDVLHAAEQRDPEQFAVIFGADSQALLATTGAATSNERMQPVAGANLWEAPWVARFRAAGAVAACQAAQNQVAIERYFDPLLAFAGRLGFDSERALAMLYDRGVQQGLGRGPAWIMAAAGPIRSERNDLPRALLALGHADLRAFQRSVPGLTVDGRFGAKSHAALTAALRDLGSASPFTVSSRDEMLTMMVAAAADEAQAADSALAEAQTALAAAPQRQDLIAARDQARRTQVWKQARAQRLDQLRHSQVVTDTLYTWA
jgi:hypothetical protein